jgi:glycosyltransferase involved in cell wall biosynthesis
VIEAPRVLLVYADRVGTSMGGVGIRAVELARVLRDELGARVTIAAAAWDGGDVGAPVVTFAPHAPRALDGPLAQADVVVAQPGWPLVMRRLRRSRARLVFDLYDPEAFGTLEHFAGRDARLRALMGAFAVDRVTAALRIGHHVMCATERQRDLWIGALLGAGLITPETYDRDPALRSLIDVVPYGVPAAPPVARGTGWRERLGIAPDDEVVLWNGGVWSWLDLPTAVRAIDFVREHRPRARLVVMGASSAPPARQATEEARALARELGLLDGGGVVFNDTWVPYERRADWLLGADCAISTHRDHLETRFSSRTRLLDCFWAGLPVVCTEGDELADRVAREDLGVVVAPGDPEYAAAGIEDVLALGRAAYAERLAAAAADHAWSRVAAPLLRWLREPPPSQRIGDGARIERRAGERLRSAAYLAGAGTLAALRVRPPRLR